MLLDDEQVEEFLKQHDIDVSSGLFVDSTGHRDLDANELDFHCDYYGDYVAMKPLNMAVKRRRIETLDGNVNETKENAPNQEVKGGGKKGASRRKGPANGCWECSADHYASECPNVRFSRTQWNTIKPAFYPQDVWGRMYEPIRQSWKEKGKGKSAGSPK